MELPSVITSLLKKMPHRADPVRDWLTLLAVAALMLGIVIAGSARLFDTVANGGSMAEPAATATPAFNDSMLRSVQTIFSERAVQEAKFASGTVQFADPSQ